MVPTSGLMLEDARSIRERLWCITRYAQDATEMLNARIEDKNLDGMAETVEVREALERLHSVSLEVREEADAYQERHAR